VSLGFSPDTLNMTSSFASRFLFLFKVIRSNQSASLWKRVKKQVTRYKIFSTVVGNYVENSFILRFLALFRSF